MVDRHGSAAPGPSWIRRRAVFLCPVEPVINQDLLVSFSPVQLKFGIDQTDCAAPGIRVTKRSA